MDASHATLAPVERITRVVVNDPWRISEPDGREITEMDHTGGALADYLPPELEGYTDQDVTVSLNGRPISDLSWKLLKPRPGDTVAVIPTVGDLTTIVIQVVIIVAGIIISMDQAKRAKIQAHHAARRAARKAAMLDGSAIYGWNGVQNTTEAGRSIPILLGRHLVGGQIVYVEPRQDTNGKVLDMVLVISQGETAGPVGGNITGAGANLLINGAPLSDYPGITVDSRNGTSTQSAMKKILPTTVPRSKTNINKQMATGVAESFITLPNRSHASFMIRVPYGVWFTGSPPGMITQAPCTISMRARFRDYPSGSFGSWITFNHQTTAYFVRTAGGAIKAKPTHFEWKSPQLSDTSARKEFEIELVSIAITTTFTPTIDTTNTRIMLSEAREFSEQPNRYIGTAVVGVSALGSEKLGGVPPTITHLHDGLLLRVYSDTTTYTEQFTRNPAWHILNILGDTEWGGGGRLLWASDFDIQSFIDAAAFCDGIVSRGTTNPLSSGTATCTTVAGTNKIQISGAGDPSRFDSVKVDDSFQIQTGADAGSYAVDEIINSSAIKVRNLVPNTGNPSFTGATGANWLINGTEKRLLSDFYIDDQTDMWEACHAIARNARCAILWVNGKIALVPDQAGSAVQIISKDLIVKGSFRREYVGGFKAANIYEAQFLNEDKDYEQDVVRYEDPAVITDDESHIPARVAMFGKTRQTDVIRSVKYHVFSNRYERRPISFQVPAAGLALIWGDRFRLGTDVQPYESLEDGADLWPTAIVVSADASSVTLDRDIYLDSDYGRVSIQHQDTDVISDVEFNTVSGWTRTLEGISWGAEGQPEAGDIALCRIVYGNNTTPTITRWSRSWTTATACGPSRPCRMTHVCTRRRTIRTRRRCST